MGHWKSGYWFESLQCQFSLNSARKVASFPPKVRQLQFLPIQIISKGSWVTFATATAIRYISKMCFFSSKLAATKKPSSDKCLPLQECVALARGDKTSYQMGVNIIELMELLPIVKHHQTQPPLTGDSLIIQVWIKGKRWKQYKKLKRLLIENVYCTKMDLQQLVERHVTHFPRYDDGFGKAWVAEKKIQPVEKINHLISKKNNNLHKKMSSQALFSRKVVKCNHEFLFIYNSAGFTFICIILSF